MAVATRLSSAQFLAREDLPRYAQLVGGEVVAVNPPGEYHQYLVTEILYALSSWTREAPARGRATHQVGVELDGANVFVPDVVWRAGDNRPPDPEVTHFSAPPDLAVEVRSPSTWRYDVGAKKSAYERHGLRELWLVDWTAPCVLVFRRSAPEAAAFDVALELAPGDELTSPQLPGFAIALDALFARG